MRTDYFYGVDGAVITMDEWAAARKDGTWERHHLVTKTDDSEVSTVWLSMDHQFDPDGPPLIFETLVFGGALADEMDRYSTWEQARAGHAAMVERVLRSERLSSRLIRKVRTALRALAVTR